MGKQHSSCMSALLPVLSKLKRAAARMAQEAHHARPGLQPRPERDLYMKVLISNNPLSACGT